jgi:hypothetical protein
MVAMRNIEVMCGMYSVYIICAVMRYLFSKIKYMHSNSRNVYMVLQMSAVRR